MAYGKIVNNTLVYAPKNLIIADGTLIAGFDTDIDLMIQYGYKEVIEYTVDYDPYLEETYIESLTQDTGNIYVQYGKRTKPTGSADVDLSNYYTKSETYNKVTVDTIIEDLKALIKDLELNHADIEDLIANNTTTNDLTAINANIQSLKAAYAEIQTLINGNLTSDNIQSLVLTVDNCTIDSALIKDLVALDILADDIKGGTLHTNNVLISSDDGSMIIQGSLQQFKDENGVVRIQLGKDAQGNFTFSLFDEAGTGVLIDSTGIKEGAIADGLIVDAMVSDNAHISGGKIDIESLFTEMNNSSQTLNSSKIYFNDQGQTLEVAFKTLSNKVDTLENISVDGDLSGLIEQVTTNTTNIEIAQGQISSLIANTTITKEDGTTVQLKDEFNSVQNTVDSHTQTINSLETTYKAALKSSSVEYYISTSATELTGGSWSSDSPTWSSGAYIWQRMKYVYTDDSVTYGTPVCIQGAKGQDGYGSDGYTVILSQELCTIVCDSEGNPIS